MWTADATDVKVTPINASGSPTEQLVGLVPINSGQWNSYDIPVADFTASGMTLNELVQMKFDGQGGTTPSNIWLDNIYFYKEGGTATEPTEAAPTPPARDAADVLSIFSDAYTGIAIGNFDPDWGQSTEVSTVDIAGNPTLKYANFNYQGTDFGGMEDASAMQYLHIDMWTADATDVKVTPINASGSPTEQLVGLVPINSGQWNSYDIPVADFTASGMTLNELVQMKFDGQGGTTPSNIWLDNIYFYKEGGTATEPTTAAPTPTHAAGDVISVFSDSYTNIVGTDFYPDWGQSTVVSEEMIEGNNTLKYAGLNYQGVVLGSTQDVSGMDFLHIDFWTANSDALNAFLISSGGETAKALSVPTSGWSSINIPLSDFSPVDLTDIIQFKFDGNGDIWLDNIYFYKTGGSPGEWSTDEIIDFETPGFGAGWSWNVFENDSNPPLEFVANPDASGINTSATVAKITALQAGQPWVGCETVHGDIGSFTFDASNATVRIMVYKSVISDVGLKFVENSGEAQPEVKVANTKINEWEELTFDLSGSIGAGITGIIDQIVVFPDFDLAGRTQDNVVYFDNIRFSAN
jgi:hypothetical protein